MTRQPYVFGYARVSTEEQNLDRQLEALKNVDILITDKMSGKNIERDGLQTLLRVVQDGDTIWTKSIDRLSRSTSDLLTVLDDLTARGVEVKFIDTPFMNTDSKEGRFFATVLGAMAEFERNTILQRQAEGIAIAKAQGKYEQDPKLSKEQVEEIRQRKINGEKITSLAKEFDVARATLYSALNGEGAYAKYYEEPEQEESSPVPAKKSA